MVVLTCSAQNGWIDLVSNMLTTRNPNFGQKVLTRSAKKLNIKWQGQRCGAGALRSRGGHGKDDKAMAPPVGSKGRHGSTVPLSWLPPLWAPAAPPRSHRHDSFGEVGQVTVRRTKRVVALYEQSAAWPRGPGVQGAWSDVAS